MEVTPKKTVNMLKRFKKISDVGTDPRWPEYTGVTTWATANVAFKTGQWTLEITRLGGITARTVYRLYWGKRYVGSKEGHAFSLKEWITEEITLHHHKGKNEG